MVEHELDTQVVVVVGGCGCGWVGGDGVGLAAQLQTLSLEALACATVGATAPCHVHACWRAPSCGRPPRRPSSQNFEQYEDEGAGLVPGGSRSRPIADPNFIGYTYKNWDAVHSKEGAWLATVAGCAAKRTVLFAGRGVVHGRDC